MPRIVIFGFVPSRGFSSVPAGMTASTAINIVFAQLCIELIFTRNCVTRVYASTVRKCVTRVYNSTVTLWGRVCHTLFSIYTHGFLCFAHTKQQ